MLRLLPLLLLASVAPPSASLLAPLARLEPLGRPLLERYLLADAAAPQPPVTAVSWFADGGSNERLQLLLWQFAAGGSAERRVVLALPTLEPRTLRELVDVMQPVKSSLRATPLPDDSPIGGLLLEALEDGGDPSARAERAIGAADDAAVVARMRAWVTRTLTPAGLKFCPYTGSASTSGTGLESSGVPAAPIDYCVAARGSSLAQLLVAFWSACARMLEGGEAATSSIILAAPGWDGDYERWSTEVFPCLEASLLASRRARDLGIVCFHPKYVTPSEEWLARHRFGHMHSTARLRGYVDEQDAPLSAATDDEALAWASAYQRRSPHAMINVLWSRQLEIAETKRRSSSLYTRNIRTALSAGRDELERAADEERRRADL